MSDHNVNSDTDIIFISDVFDNTNNNRINSSILNTRSSERDRAGSIPDNMKKFMKLMIFITHQIQTVG